MSRALFQVRARWPVPTPTCVVRSSRRGSKLGGKPKGARSIRAATGEGKTGRVNCVNPR